MTSKEICRELKKWTEEELEGCKRKTDSGITILTPDGMGNYDALWTRDFAYMAEYAGDLIPDALLQDGVEYLLSHQRQTDGWYPDRVDTHGTAIYSAGNPDLPCGEANLDNTPFLAIAFALLLDRVDADRAKELVEKYIGELRRGLMCIPLEQHGLVWNDPHHPHSPYGFTDCIGKTGALMMESILLWRACRMLTARLRAMGICDRDMEQVAGRIAKELENVFYEKESGMLLAASKDCRQIDVWGSCYALSVGFPLSVGCIRSIQNWLILHAKGILEHGQLRHTAPEEYWHRLLLPVPQGEYQNGAYWATATGWFVDAVAPVEPELAHKTLLDVVSYFKNQGVFECVNGSYQKLNHFVVSAANTYGAAKRYLNAG